MKINELFLELVNNPFAPKIYRDLAKAYEKDDKENSELFYFVIDEKFNNTNTVSE